MIILEKNGITIEQLMDPNHEITIYQNLSAICSFLTGRSLSLDTIQPDESASNIARPDVDSDDDMLNSLIRQIDDLERDASLVSGTKIHRELLNQRKQKIDNLKRRMDALDTRQNVSADLINADKFFSNFLDNVGFYIDLPMMTTSDFRNYLRRQTTKNRDKMGWIEDEYDDIRLQLRNENFLSEEILKFICVISQMDLIILNKDKPTYKFNLKTVCPEELYVDYNHTIYYHMDKDEMYLEAKG